MDESINIAKILKEHKQWLESDGEKGARANLSRANLAGANLSWANLSRATLEGANLSRANLSRANLSRATLEGANLSRATLEGANLSRATLEGANLSWANLSWATLEGANLDFAVWPLWCGSLKAKIDKAIAAQLLYHWMRVIESVDDETLRMLRNDVTLIAFANQFQRADECGRLRSIAKEKETHDAERR